MSERGRPYQRWSGAPSVWTHQPQHRFARPRAVALRFKVAAARARKHAPSGTTLMLTGLLCFGLPEAAAALVQAVSEGELDFTRRVAPLDYDYDAWNVSDSSDVTLVEVTRSRLDQPQPPPPVVPIGLRGIPWALHNIADAWRLLFPIPPEHAPELVLPAEPTGDELIVSD